MIAPAKNHSVFVHTDYNIDLIYHLVGTSSSHSHTMKVQVFCFAIVVLAIHCVQANPLLKGPDAVEYENYVNCVQEVQNKCENSEAPFEVLVQGPSGNRFVRSLVLADGSEAELEAVDPKHVSTFSIYQPKHLVKRDIEADIAEAVTGTLNNGDTAAIGEQTRPVPGTETLPVAAADAAKDGDEKVGLALPIAPLIGLGALNRHIGIRNAARLLPLGVGVHTLTNPGLNPITNPVLNPIVNPGIIPARLAALRARVAALPIGAAAALI